MFHFHKDYRGHFGGRQDNVFKFQESLLVEIMDVIRRQDDIEIVRQDQLRDEGAFRNFFHDFLIKIPDYRFENISGDAAVFGNVGAVRVELAEVRIAGNDLFFQFLEIGGSAPWPDWTGQAGYMATALSLTLSAKQYFFLLRAVNTFLISMVIVFWDLRVLLLILIP